MFDKFTQFAEQGAKYASRRQFLGAMGRDAAGAAAVLGSLLLLPSDAAAANKHCHGQICPPGYTYCCKAPAPKQGHWIWYCSPAPCSAGG